jgi:hypothetical protein
MEDLRMSTNEKVHEFDESSSPLPVFIAEFGPPIAVLCVALALIGISLFVPMEPQIIWQEPGIYP